MLFESSLTYVFFEIFEVRNRDLLYGMRNGPRNSLEYIASEYEPTARHIDPRGYCLKSLLGTGATTRILKWILEMEDFFMPRVQVRKRSTEYFSTIATIG